MKLENLLANVTATEAVAQDNPWNMIQGKKVIKQLSDGIHEVKINKVTTSGNILKFDVTDTATDTEGEFRQNYFEGVMDILNPLLDQLNVSEFSPEAIEQSDETAVILVYKNKKGYTAWTANPSTIKKALMNSPKKTKE